MSSAAPGAPPSYLPASVPPEASAPPPPPAYSAAIPDHEALRAALGDEFPPGLRHALVDSCTTFKQHYFIVDNSGSMSTPDGSKLVTPMNGSAPRFVGCSRWEEVVDMITFHAKIAAALNVPTHFMLLNQPAVGRQHVVVRGPEDLADLDQTCRSSPTSTTPLCAQVTAVVDAIARDEAALRASGLQVALTIVSDGLPTDGDLKRAMAPLARLPVWVVVRLCTDEEAVVDFWSNLDADLECERARTARAQPSGRAAELWWESRPLSWLHQDSDMDVLDDLASEAQEVCTHSPWLCYGQPIHRVREWGVRNKIFDLIDERALTPAEARALVMLVLGGDELPHPEVDLRPFVEAVAQRQAQLGGRMPFNPVRKRHTPWIDTAQLQRRIAQPGGRCAIS